MNFILPEKCSPVMRSIKKALRANLKNMSSWRTSRKIIVFESDDWGSIRIPSFTAYKELLKKGIPLSSSRQYDKCDTLAGEKDLEMLFEVLTSVKDKDGNPAVFSPFVNPSNPDFAKIKESNYQNYFHKTFFQTLEEQGELNKVKSLWMKGIEQGFFLPAYHGREHLCVPLWMRELQNGNTLVRKAFELDFYAVQDPSLPAKAGAFRPALFFDQPGQIPFLKNSLIEGYFLMKYMFGRSPKVFCPPNGISHQVFDQAIKEAGIETIVAKRLRDEPDGKGGTKTRSYAFGKKNKSGQIHYFRNCGFEPVHGRGVDTCLKDIKVAFRWRKPAIISTHRVNYIGAIDPANRDKGLAALKILLKEILNNWPEVEFLSSEAWAQYLAQKNHR